MMTLPSAPCGMTSGLGRLSSRERSNDFTPDNDPHNEHDFGSFEIDDLKFIFKHDYYDKSMQYGSEDPGEPKKTTRVLTIMLTDEY